MASYKGIGRLLAVILLFFQISIGIALKHGLPLPTPAAQLPRRNGTEFDKRDDTQTEMSTCGYLNGDPKNPRTANSGFDCRVDTKNGLWGFCPVTVISAIDCGLAGSCVDQGSCSMGCGKLLERQLTTFTCGPKQFCSTALLTFGVDQTYSYIACGGSPKTDHYLNLPTTDAISTSPSSQTTTTEEPSSLITPAATQTTTSAPSGETTQTTPPNGSGSNENSGSSTNNTGAIIGGVIGGIALLCLSGLAAILLMRKNRSISRRTQTERGQQNSHQSWYQPSAKNKHRFTGGWAPAELQGTQDERIRVPVQAVELAG